MWSHCGFGRKGRRSVGEFSSVVCCRGCSRRSRVAGSWRQIERGSCVPTGCTYLESRAVMSRMDVGSRKSERGRHHQHMCQYCQWWTTKAIPLIFPITLFDIHPLEIEQNCGPITHNTNEPCVDAICQNENTQSHSKNYHDDNTWSSRLDGSGYSLLCMASNRLCGPHSFISGSGVTLFIFLYKTRLTW